MNTQKNALEVGLAHPLLLLLLLVTFIAFMVGQRSPRVRVNYGGRTYAIPGSFPSQQAADKARDLLVLLLPHFSQAGPIRKAPGLRNPRGMYVLPSFPGFLAIPQELRPRLAAAIGVSENPHAGACGMYMFLCVDHHELCKQPAEPVGYTQV